MFNGIHQWSHITWIFLYRKIFKYKFYLITRYKTIPIFLLFLEIVLAIYVLNEFTHFIDWHKVVHATYLLISPLIPSEMSPLLFLILLVSISPFFFLSLARGLPILFTMFDGLYFISNYFLISFATSVTHELWGCM